MLCWALVFDCHVLIKCARAREQQLDEKKMEVQRAQKGRSELEQQWKELTRQRQMARVGTIGLAQINFACVINVSSSLFRHDLDSWNVKLVPAKARLGR